jgi:hypothetical protein
MQAILTMTMLLSFFSLFLQQVFCSVAPHIKLKFNDILLLVVVEAIHGYQYKYKHLRAYQINWPINNPNWEE